MGRRDYRRREPKKHKKDARKILPASALSAPLTVETVKKAKKERREEE